MPVISKLISGADLMIPGIVVPQEGIPDVKKGDLVSIAACGRCNGNRLDPDLEWDCQGGEG
ncbi:Eukaryotic translation initiation factor 2D, partial [Spiromyces aspiralis]